MFDWSEQGHLPAPGSVLEQSQSFMDALRCYRHEVNLAKAARANG